MLFHLFTNSIADRFSLKVYWQILLTVIVRELWVFPCKPYSKGKQGWLDSGYFTDRSDVNTSHVFPQGLLATINLLGCGSGDGEVRARPRCSRVSPLLSGCLLLGTRTKLLEQKPWVLCPRWLCSLWCVLACIPAPASSPLGGATLGQESLAWFGAWGVLVRVWRPDCFWYAV